MKRFSEMTERELAEEIERLADTVRQSGSEGERSVLSQRWLMARSYAVRNKPYPPGTYRVEDTGERFEMEYVNGVMGWGKTENGETRAFPLAALQKPN